MVVNSYIKLKKDLEELQVALDSETNPEMAEEIKAHISEVNRLIEDGDYDLSVDDLFECVVCKQIQDIEDSVKVGHSYLCDACAD